MVNFYWAHVCIDSYICTLISKFIVRINYHTQENLVGEKLANLANCELFAKIFLANIHRYMEYALTVAYSPNFSVPIAFPPPNIPVYGIG